MTQIEKAEFADRMKAMSNEEKKIALEMFDTKMLIEEILRRLLLMEKKFKEMRNILK